MARTMDPTTNTNPLFSTPSTNSPFATNWTHDSWYNVYSWVNSQSNDSETGESSIRSSTSSQPQTSPSSGCFDDRDHPLLCDAPSSPFERLESSSRPSPLFFNNNNNNNNKEIASQNWYNPAPQVNPDFLSDTNLIQELLRLQLNVDAPPPPPPPPPQPKPTPKPATNHLFSSTPSTSSPWSLPPSTNTWNTTTNEAKTDFFTQLAATSQKAPSGVDMTYLMQQQQQQQQQAALAAHQPANNKTWSNAKVVMQRYNMVVQLQSKLEDVTEEYRQLEKERKQTEAELARHNLGKKISSSNGLPIPRLPTAPSRVDRLIVDFFREHARISTLLGKMEQLRNTPMPLAVHQTLAELLDSVTLLQHNRNHERNAILQQLRGESVHYDEEKEAAELCQALCLVRRAATRVRAANWCSLMTTLGPLDDNQRLQIEQLIASDYTIPPPPIRPRPIRI